MRYLLTLLVLLASAVAHTSPPRVVRTPPLKALVQASETPTERILQYTDDDGNIIARYGLTTERLEIAPGHDTEDVLKSVLVDFNTLTKACYASRQQMKDLIQRLLQHEQELLFERQKLLLELNRK